MASTEEQIKKQLESSSMQDFMRTQVEKVACNTLPSIIKNNTQTINKAIQSKIKRLDEKELVRAFVGVIQKLNLNASDFESGSASEGEEKKSGGRFNKTRKNTKK